MARNFPTQDEIAAKNICCKFLNYDANSLVISDSPDLQDSKNNVGVEVRNVMNKIDGKNNAFVQANYNSQKKIKEKNDALENMHIKGENIDLGFIHIFVDARVNNVKLFYQNHIDEFVIAYEDKLNKLNSGNYQTYRENNLFLFCDNFNECEINQAISTLANNKKCKKYSSLSNQFNYIYAYAFEYIYVIDSDFNVKQKINHTI